MTRLKKFRSLMSDLEDNPPNKRSFAKKHYIENSARPISFEIAKMVELKPNSTHLILGGIGSGKTTEMIIAMDRLVSDDILVKYIDVSTYHDLTSADPGLLLVIAGYVLSKYIDNDASEDAKKAKDKFSQWANGYSFYIPIYDSDDFDEYDHDYDEPPFEEVSVSPVLKSPKVKLNHDIEIKQTELKKITDELLKSKGHVTIFFDSLDRLNDATAFSKLVEQDIRALKNAKVGVVIVGPLQALYGQYRSITDYFDRYYHKSALDVNNDTSGLIFLENVLRSRAPKEILPDLSCTKIAKWSGGVLRDLIMIAQSAAEEAYFDGSDFIENFHVDKAADNLGRKYMLGIDKDQLKTLKNLDRTGSFVPVTDSDLSLLVTRRVLEYGNSRFGLHPTIIPLLNKTGKAE